MALPGRAPSCCPLGKATQCTPSSDQATFPFLSSMKALTAGSPTLSLPIPSLGRSDSEPRQPQTLLRGPSHLCGVWRKLPSRINSVGRWGQQLQWPSPQPPTDLSDPSLQLPQTAHPHPPRPACPLLLAGAAWVVTSFPGATSPSQ